MTDVLLTGQLLAQSRCRAVIVGKALPPLLASRSTVTLNAGYCTVQMDKGNAHNFRGYAAGGDIPLKWTPPTHRIEKLWANTANDVQTYDIL